MPPKSSYLFVNDNPDSVAQEGTHKAPAKDVKAHVQNVAFQKKKQEKQERIRHESSRSKSILPRTVPPPSFGPENRSGSNDGHVQAAADFRTFSDDGRLSVSQLLEKSFVAAEYPQDEEEVASSFQPSESGIVTRRSTPFLIGSHASLNRSPQARSVQPFGAGRIDPFNSFPVNLNSLDNSYLEQYLKIMPMGEFDVNEKSPLVPSNHLIQTSSPAAFHAILACGATHLAMITGTEESSAFAYHLTESMKLVRLGLGDASNMSTMSGLIQAVTELIAIEDMKGRIAEQRVHLVGLKKMVQSQGGFQALQNEPRLQMQIIYVIAATSTDYLSHLSELLQTFHILTPTAALTEFRAHLAHFRQFLGSIISTSTSPWYSSATALAHRPQQLALFRPGSFAHTILSRSLAGLNRTDTPGLGFDTSHGFASLIYLYLALLPYSLSSRSPSTITTPTYDANHPPSPRPSENYLRHLYLAFIENKLDRRQNVHLFFVVLLQKEGGTGLASSEWAWSMIRIMQVVKRLTWRNAESLGWRLLELLMLSQPGSAFGRGLDGIVEEIGEWEDMLRTV